MHAARSRRRPPSTAKPPSSIRRRLRLVAKHASSANAKSAAARMEPLLHQPRPPWAPVRVGEEDGMHDMDRTLLEFAPGVDQEGENFEVRRRKRLRGRGGRRGRNCRQSVQRSRGNRPRERVARDHRRRRTGLVHRRVDEARGARCWEFSPIAEGPCAWRHFKGRRPESAANSRQGCRRIHRRTSRRSAGRQAPSLAGQRLGLELEGLSDEDAQFEMARQFVRLGGAAAVRATAGPANLAPMTAAQGAMLAASRRYAPGLVPQGRGAYGTRTGRWYRRGRRIVLVGV